MNNKEIIESGKLELYVCGALSEREMREIALLANLNPELKEEIARIENNLVSFAEGFEQQPASDTFEKIQKRIKAGNKTFQVDFKTRSFNWTSAAGFIGSDYFSFLQPFPGAAKWSTQLFWHHCWS